MPILINGSKVDISHLASFSEQIDLPLSAGVIKKKAWIEFRFSCHCYSRGPSAGEAIPPGMLIADGSIQKPRNRIFSWKRYTLSLDLAEKIKIILLNNGDVQYSRNLNFFSTSSELITEDGKPVPVDYYIFMQATKKQEPQKPKKIDIFVESAYPGDPNIPAPVPKGDPRPILEVLGAVWEGK